MKLTFKKTLGMLGTVMALGLVLAGCGNKSTDNSVKKIQDKKTLVVGTSADYAPFEFPIMQNGKKKIVGYDMMIAQKIADDLGVKLKIENTEFPSLISELKNNKIDLIMAGMVSTNERKKVVAFSNSYYTVENVLLVQKKDANNFNNVSDVKGKQIGAQQTTTQESIAKSQLKGSNVVTEGVLTSLTTELSQGKLSGVVVENEIANNYIRQYPDKYAIAKVKLTTPKDQRSVNIAARKSDKALLKRVNKQINKLKKSGELDKMFKKAEDLQAKNAD
ncbi:ABC transporter substrate-binding protein [Liquorilactobacillus aquaticus DSM 21051]|uniref:ABC transporter substrate-binding protein n=1 Tax=Liquorilactobacillus aquaticus DSM 21051 TaxID=1423725 RepID=A0A0R2D0A2_9LACO|nr:transporter substrate-binding domain-containing protein [Liquorilactobacillus aquaticus]KRM97453.1 ABC transporter substrate-binding protein [Liquorilactobacillus aquaticus DSM 21051]